jgi:hypothetical protein
VLGGDDGYNFMSLGFQKLDGQFHNVITLNANGATERKVTRKCREEWAAHTAANAYFASGDPPRDEGWLRPVPRALFIIGIQRARMVRSAL